MADFVKVALSQPGLAYTQTTLALTANQIAGTVPIVAANANRRGIKFGGASQSIVVSLVAGSGAGMSYAASFRDGDAGPECPTGALYLATGQGLAAGATIVVWEA